MAVLSATASMTGRRTDLLLSRRSCTAITQSRHHLNLPSSLAVVPRRRFSSDNKREQQIRMLLVGSPGSGKGTLSTLLHQTYPQLHTISTGDLLRSHIQTGSSLGQKADQVIKAGGLLPDKDVMSMIGKEVESMGSEKDWLLDGFPRTFGQAEMLDEALQRGKRPLNLVVNLDVPQSVILGRILDRWVHPASGRVYNTSYNPPKNAGKDDETGEPLVQRSDDNEATFRARLKAFYDQTGPMIERYRNAVDSRRVFVDLHGKETKEIWPQLQAVMRDVYGL